MQWRSSTSAAWSARGSCRGTSVNCETTAAHSQHKELSAQAAAHGQFPSRRCHPESPNHRSSPGSCGGGSEAFILADAHMKGITAPTFCRMGSLCLGMDIYPNLSTDVGAPAATAELSRALQHEVDGVEHVQLHCVLGNAVLSGLRNLCQAGIWRSKQHKQQLQGLAPQFRGRRLCH